MKILKLVAVSPNPEYIGGVSANMKNIAAAMTLAKKENPELHLVRALLVVGSGFIKVADSDKAFPMCLDYEQRVAKVEIGCIGHLYGCLVWNPERKHPDNPYASLTVGEFEIGVTDISSHTVFPEEA